MKFALCLLITPSAFNGLVTLQVFAEPILSIRCHHMGLSFANSDNSFFS